VLGLRLEHFGVLKHSDWNFYLNVKVVISIRNYHPRNRIKFSFLYQLLTSFSDFFVKVGSRLIEKGFQRLLDFFVLVKCLQVAVY
jgi:hypothetical protein